jgi:hypothetical protein
VVLLRADQRCPPRAGPHRRRADVLLAAALHARRRAQRRPRDAAEGQARQPQQRQQRGRR